MSGVVLGSEMCVVDIECEDGCGRLCGCEVEMWEGCEVDVGCVCREIVHVLRREEKNIFTCGCSSHAACGFCRQPRRSEVTQIWN